mmetsp:Transcript_33958/g.74489  ORF Transcript_33958/g.74489 Transcript_33958/m.74489 type:complete len:130 (-) Transcript_33958:382-771(-)
MLSGSTTSMTGPAIVGPADSLSDSAVAADAKLRVRERLPSAAGGVSSSSSATAGAAFAAERVVVPEPSSTGGQAAALADFETGVAATATATAAEAEAGAEEASDPPDVSLRPRLLGLLLVARMPASAFA